ncbi:hypothetical protein [Neptuniibacter sp. QD37_11]|uniref:hypothetical protein n=1 Tax=Neptuniibacter sp. QD37_11 TaxID=3398209 RepID=UPI0039F5868D
MIVGVAVKYKNGCEIRLPKPNRHSDCFKRALERHGLCPTQHAGAKGQGFYTDKGEYLNREEAMTHVREVGQELLPDWQDGQINKSNALTSEDLW